jgi:beta-glucosidase
LINPGGRLPVTFYRATSDLPPIEDYDMHQRTYRYFTGDPLYAFGFGLSYTAFTYRNLKIAPAEARPGKAMAVQVEVENAGERLGDEVVQLYVQDAEASLPVPQLSCRVSAHSASAGREADTVCRDGRAVIGGR